MQSHCLKHQERVATARCAACSIPLCDECVQPYEDGKYCSDKCYQSVQDGKVRMAKMAAEEEATRKRRRTLAAIKLIIYLAIGLGLYFGWDQLPENVTDLVESSWDKFKSAFNGKG